MGVALPLAIGAAIGSKREICVVAGDGGFHMNIQELQTVKNYDLPVRVYVLDNSGYAMIKQFQARFTLRQITWRRVKLIFMADLQLILQRLPERTVFTRSVSVT